MITFATLSYQWKSFHEYKKKIHNMHSFSFNVISVAGAAFEANICNLLKFFTLYQSQMLSDWYWYIIYSKKKQCAINTFCSCASLTHYCKVEYRERPALTSMKILQTNMSDDNMLYIQHLIPSSMPLYRRSNTLRGTCRSTLTLNTMTTFISRLWFLKLLSAYRIPKYNICHIKNNCATYRKFKARVS